MNLQLLYAHYVYKNNKQSEKLQLYFDIFVQETQILIY